MVTPDNDSITPLFHSLTRLNNQVKQLTFSHPVTHVYNPLDYAQANYLDYLYRFGRGKKRAIFLGMNPGPWGMVQTGIPFGDIETVKTWLAIDLPIARPDVEHPKREVLGLRCKRVEVSGARLWGAVRDHFGEPDRFFNHYFVANYCPLAFMEASGRNRTPDKLPLAERTPLFAACDHHLRDLLDAMQPDFLVGIGGFAEERAQGAIEARPIRVARILHPSPANPLANDNWAGRVKKQVTELNLCHEC